MRFHTIIWPIMLMALGEPLPKQVFGHGWLIMEGGKMSKSKGNVVDPVVLVNRYGLDALRYFLLREVPFGSDGVFSNESLINRINSDLANDVGNLLSRTIAMIEKYFDGDIPACGELTDLDKELKTLALETPKKVEKLMDELLFSDALAEIWKLVSRCNKYIDETTPWVLAKSESERPRLGTVMYHLAEGLRFLSVLIAPFMTRTPALMQEQLGILPGENTTWESLNEFGRLQAGTSVSRGEIIFPRLDLEKELDALEKLKKADEPEVDDKIEILPEITIDDFAKIDLRVAKVVAAEKVKKADKLLKLTLDVGGKSRQVISGIAQSYSPEEMVGKSVIIVANLKPVTLRGIQSEGMILAASDDGGKLVLVTVSEEIESGVQVQ